MKYRIFETDNFVKNLDALLAGGSQRVAEKLRTVVYPQLKEEPHFGPQIKKLRDWAPPTWRYRIGDWRFFYEIDERSNIIYITTVHHRKEAYRR